MAARRRPSEVAEGVGFEPTVTQGPQRLSRPPHSSVLATLRGGHYSSADGVRKAGSSLGPAGAGQRRSAKKSVSSAAPASAATPAVTVNSWFRRGSAPTL